jgi:hypothetical protein
MEVFVDFWLGSVWEVVRQPAEQGAADEGQIGQQIGVS